MAILSRRKNIRVTSHLPKYILSFRHINRYIPSLKGVMSYTVNLRHLHRKIKFFLLFVLLNMVLIHNRNILSMLDETKVKNIHLDSNTTPTVEAKLQADKKAPPMLDETKAKNIHIDSKNTPTVEAEPQTDKKLPVVACAMYTYHGNRHLIT